MKEELCLIVDFGSQYTQLIARKLRELSVFSRVVPPSELQAEANKNSYLKAVILSGGPQSVVSDSTVEMEAWLRSTSIPVLGICYGMQLIAKSFGGEVHSGVNREYGVDRVLFEDSLLHVKSESLVLLSHGDHVEKVPSGFRATARSGNGVLASFENAERKIFGFQFHPEVKHTPLGSQMLEKFLKLAGFSFDWEPSHIFLQLKDQLEKQFSGGRILCAVSGGVDSTVLAVLLNKSFPGKVDCFCVDTGLLRKNELQQLKELFEKNFYFDIHLVDAEQRFLSELKNVLDPEQKRKIIGRVFIEVFEEERKRLEDTRYLAQGTLYPDVIESTSAHGGKSAKIKSHHNVGGLPENLNFELMEPFRFLFKDEVRSLGEYLGLPHDFVWRHPFPGPGLAVRIVGEVTKDRLDRLREADARLQSILKETGFYEKLWQSFCVYLPIRSVGVMGDGRTYEESIAIRCVHSEDGMTAHIADLPVQVLEKISSKIINEVPGINRVVYDISSKPPSTIEWE